MDPDTLALAARTVAWIAGTAAALFVLDRALSWMELRGWIYYRRSKGAGRGAASYHLLEMSSIMDPSMRAAQEILVKEEQAEDEAGDPLGPDRNAEEPEGAGNARRFPGSGGNGSAG